jgi:hypothetical protein
LSKGIFRQKFFYTLQVKSQQIAVQVLEMTAKRHKVSAAAEDVSGLLAAKRINKDVVEVIDCFVSDLLWLEWLQKGGQGVLDSLQRFYAWSVCDGAEHVLPSDNLVYEEINPCHCYACECIEDCGKLDKIERVYRRF